MKLLERGELQDVCSEIMRERGIWWEERIRCKDWERTVLQSRWRVISKGCSGRKRWNTKEIRARMENFWKGQDNKYFRLCKSIFS